MNDGTGTYETWVIALRRWRDDPTVEMSGLPLLASDTFSPPAYARLIGHVNDAMSVMMTSWNLALNKVWTSSPSPHDLARELVQLRSLLARRLQLARHPSFPPEISSALWEGALNDIRRIQLDLEKSVAASGSRATTDRDTTELILDVVRKNSFAAITEPGFPLDSIIANPAAQDPALHPLPFPPDPMPVRRRVVID